MLKTRLTELLGIRYPIISAPMIRFSGGSLAAAVSSAGGLGTFGASGPTADTGPDYVRDQISYIRSQTNQPFGVGFITHYMPTSPKNFDVVIEEEVKVFVFSFADPRPWMSIAREHGATVVCQVQTFESAREVVAAGADVLVAQGNEAGGHTGEMNLLPFLVRLIEEFPHIPVIASGGIATGRSLAAVLAAGAEGALIGTAFLATQEANEVTDAHKELVIKSDGDDTVYSEVFDIVNNAMAKSPPWPTGIAGRAYNNRFVQEWRGREDELRERLEEVLPAYVEARQRRDLDIASVWIGESAAFIDAIRPAAQVLQSICDDAERLLLQRSAELVQ